MALVSARPNPYQVQFSHFCLVASAGAAPKISRSVTPKAAASQVIEACGCNPGILLPPAAE